MSGCNKLEERNWELLIDAVDKERVVPIIGDEFFYIIEDGKEVSIHDFIIGKLVQKFNNVNESYLDYSTINDVIELENYINLKVRFNNIQTDIYYEIHEILRAPQILVRESLKQLLKLNKFPLILTTTFIPRLNEILTQEGYTYRIIEYTKSTEPDISPTMICGHTPTIYHMFGKCGKSKKSYMVTEEDLIEYMHHWHDTDSRPPYLTKYLSDKFLLVLGCNYPNWLFKFFWYAVRNFRLIPKVDNIDERMNVMQAVVSIDKERKDAELERFLSRIHTSIYDCSVKFIDDLTAHWNNYISSISPDDIDNKAETSMADDEIDIFISYASEDLEIAKKVAEMLTSLGAKLWFDKDGLKLSDKFEVEITNAIKKAKRFMPLLSENTLKPEARFFRKEWKIADDASKERFGLKYISPIIIDYSDEKDERIPESFRDCHIISFQSADIRKELQRFIRSIR